MEIGILFKIAAVGILVSILCQLLKNSGMEKKWQQTDSLDIPRRGGFVKSRRMVPGTES